MGSLAASESILTDEGRALLEELQRVRDDSLVDLRNAYRERKSTLDELYQQSNVDVCNNFRLQRDNVFKKYRR